MPPDTDSPRRVTHTGGDQAPSGAAPTATRPNKPLAPTVDFDFTDLDNPALTHVPVPDAVRTQPMARSQTLQTASRRVLVVSADPEERLHLRACLALCRLVWLDESSTTTQARSAMADQAHVLVFINLDAAVIDSSQLVKELKLLRPKALVLATTVGHNAVAGGRWRVWSALRWWWQQRAAKQAGFDGLLHKPLHSSAVTQWAKQVLQVYQKI